MENDPKNINEIKKDPDPSDVEAEDGLRITESEEKKILFNASSAGNVPKGFIIPGKNSIDTPADEKEIKDTEAKKADAGQAGSAQSQMPGMSRPVAEQQQYGAQPAIQNQTKARMSECPEGSAPTPKGATILKVTGIIFIIFGAISLLSSLTSFASIKMVKDITDVDPNYAAALEELGMSLETFKKMASLLRIAGSVIAAMEIALGIIGVKFCKEIEKAKICLISGFIYAFFEIGSVIASAFLLYSGPARIISFISLPFSLALPVLFLLGAFRNLRSVKK